VIQKQCLFINNDKCALTKAFVLAHVLFKVDCRLWPFAGGSVLSVGVQRGFLAFS